MSRELIDLVGKSIEVTRDEIRGVLNVLAINRPVSMAFFRESMKDVIETIDQAELDILDAIRAEDAYSDDAWNPDDLVILTTFIPEDYES